MYRAITRKIEVTVTPRFIAERSSPSNGYYFWSYTIDIANHGSETVQLKTRHAQPARRHEPETGPGQGEEEGKDAENDDQSWPDPFPGENRGGLSGQGITTRRQALCHPITCFACPSSPIHAALPVSQRRKLARLRAYSSARHVSPDLNQPMFQASQGGILSSPINSS